MRTLPAAFLTLLFCLLSATLSSAEKDAAGCKDHPLIPRMPGYFIAGCSETPAEADLDIIQGATTTTVHFKGKSSVFLFNPQPDITKKTSEAELRDFVDQAITKMNGSLFALTAGQKWPVYIVAKDGKEYWIVLLIDSGQYFTGSYACRVIEKK